MNVNYAAQIIQTRWREHRRRAPRSPWLTPRPSPPPPLPPPRNAYASVRCEDVPHQDYLDEYLDHYESLCTRYRDAYNIFAVKLKNRHNMITLPLLVITSATGVIASLQINRIIGIIVGASSAVLTAVQRYCSYAERSENARMTAKSYSKTIRKIGNMKLIRRSEMVMTSNDIFAKFLREVQAEVDSAQENAQDVPWELLQYIDTVDASVCCFPVKGLHSDTKIDRSLNGIPLNRVVAAHV
ncbi:hypothetical protein [Yellowstone lake phycodnavirus 3]|uniref:hypothetical protein n=1 Tax=Yellowstone lake phycodnavirus 3 TaxID=1586715 RepID=UPI0006EB3B63|nr:hypothetical protein AR677_gp055 [Yellowstone lake phycodnavirus 3]BAT22554.1 hypothetical protein [Yellowstone lake phycodnavirus 3]